jgi:hypothetical protein
MSLVKNSFADKSIKFFLNLKSNHSLPNNIQVMNPYENAEVKKIIIKFFTKYFNDKKKRIFVIGINPGRFGGGITGICFTDPIALQNYCGINNSFAKKSELSSKFVYSFITQFSDVKTFYSKYYLTALYPFALLENEKNYNYYDNKKIYEILKSKIIDSIKKQIEFGCYNDFVICLGKKNAKYLYEINDEYNFFKKIIVLEHPRYIMQYKLKSIQKYFNQYLKAFKL